VKLVIAALCIVLFCETVVVAQRRLDFELGVRTGVPITKPLSRVSTAPCCGISTESFPRTLIVGPTVGVVIFDRVQVELEALYRPLRLSSESRATGDNLVFTTSSVTRIRGALWEFPLIANYRFFRGAVRPYTGGGLVLVTSQSGTTENRNITTTGVELRNLFDFSRRNWFSASVINAGLEWNMHRLEIRPELRYGHGYQDPFLLSRHPNQLEFFMGFAFRGLIE